ncbi:pilus assembly protein TadG-related protein [Mariniblastus sp.]|nr:pilus assembly protein TadG-related protein [Mariniblastus sp.]
MNKSRSRRSRTGQSLLLVIFMLVVLAGIMALTLDFGFVLQSRRLMQTGVDTAALEGLRNLDTDNDNVGDGRQNAAALLRNVFDDDLDPTSNSTTVGAGIDSSLVQGDGFRQTILGNGTGSQSLYENRSEFIYRPDPQLNTLNLPNGDMVAGQYIENATSHQEFSDYERADFSVGALGDPSSAFLTRMRRTHDPDGEDRISGVSSGSGGLPLLMGRLGWFSVRPANSSYSIRRDGVTVRATAIADQKITVRVWVTTDTKIFSAIPFGVSKSDFVSKPDISADIKPTTAVITQFGQLAQFAPAGSYSGEVGYIAVIDETLSSPRAIGFFQAGSASASSRQANASSRLQDVWGGLSELTPSERSSLWASRAEVGSTSANQLLKSGVLVRAFR